MSKCFGSAENYKPKRRREPESVIIEDVDFEPDHYDLMEEKYRRRQETWDTEFTNLEQYVKAKLRMLRKDMYIEPSGKNIAHLRSLKTKTAIDAAVHSIIDRAWSDD